MPRARERATGLLRHRSIPAAAGATSSGSREDVSRISGRCSSAGSRSRMARASPSPSTSGMAMSTRTRSNSCVRIVSSARAGEATATLVTSHQASCSVRMCRLVGLSSTTSTWVPPSSSRAPSVVSPSKAPVGGRSGTSIQKVLPRPTSLSTPMVPPAASTISWEIASPSPVPPKCRVVELSPWRKGLKIDSTRSGATPIPVSRTSTRKRGAAAVPSRVARIATSPSAVNFTALDPRFVSTCSRRVGSPEASCGTSGLHETWRSSDFARAVSASTPATWSSRSRTSKSTISSSRRPASILEKSRMSLISASSDRLDRSTPETR